MTWFLLGLLGLLAYLFILCFFSGPQRPHYIACSGAAWLGALMGRPIVSGRSTGFGEVGGLISVELR